MTGPRYDTIVIGAGVIGLAIAWRAAQRGLTVAIADPQPGAGATHAAAGMLGPVSEAAYAEQDLLALGLSARARYPSFAAELTELTGLPTGFTQTGTLQVAYDADDLAVLHRLHDLQVSHGVEALRVTARQARALEPMLAPSVRGGLHVPGDGSVDPRTLTRALLGAAAQAGVILHRQRVAEVALAGGRATGVTLADGSALASRAVVLAAGWQSGGIGGVPAGVLPPVRPVKGQILRLRGASPLLSRPVRGVVRGSSVYLVPRASGELVVGATQEELGADTRVTAGGVWELLRDAREILPGITELELAEAIAGLRPGTPDNAPVLGPSALPGLVLATGHFRGGILLAPVTADLIAELLDTERLPQAAAR
ncbi:MAG TPA: glycine oxidase ThiO, partial [Streptosporangiaceae bacterium]|nr:glycine oxidase ThiO [Streptosporangiaceae bacterium]